MIGICQDTYSGKNYRGHSPKEVIEWLEREENIEKDVVGGEILAVVGRVNASMSENIHADVREVRLVDLVDDCNGDVGTLGSRDAVKAFPNFNPTTWRTSLQHRTQSAQPSEGDRSLRDDDCNTSLPPPSTKTGRYFRGQTKRQVESFSLYLSDIPDCANLADISGSMRRAIGRFAYTDISWQQTGVYRLWTTENSTKLKLLKADVQICGVPIRISEEPPIPDDNINRVVLYLSEVPESCKIGELIKSIRVAIGCQLIASGGIMIHDGYAEVDVVDSYNLNKILNVGHLTDLPMIKMSPTPFPGQTNNSTAHRCVDVRSPLVTTQAPMNTNNSYSSEATSVDTTSNEYIESSLVDQCCDFDMDLIVHCDDDDNKMCRPFRYEWSPTEESPQDSDTGFVSQNKKISDRKTYC